jgi:hypothetical protein
MPSLLPAAVEVAAVRTPLAGQAVAVVLVDCALLPTQL